MEKIYCPACNELLPISARYCAFCGISLNYAGGDTIPYLEENDGPTIVYPDDLPTLQGNEAGPFVKIAELDAEETISAGVLLADDDRDSLITDHDGTLLSAPVSGRGLQPYRGNLPATALASRRNGVGSSVATTPLLQDQWNYLNGIQDDDPTQQVTWYKEVEHPAVQISVTYPPRPSPSGPIPLIRYKVSQRVVSPKFFFWASLIVVITLVFGGVFGVLVSSGRGLKSARSGDIALQVTPNTVAFAALITLRGTNFSSHGRIGLTRDISIPITDTNGSVITNADSLGNFADTVVVTDDWGSGPHTLSAEDAITHKTASFAVLVTGQGHTSLPPHMRASTRSLDFGLEDQATNSTKTIILSNAGGGQISWQGSSNRPWLEVSPQHGSYVGGAQVTIGVDRNNLSVGPYSGEIHFTSNAGEEFVTVTMQVVALPSTPEAVLQIDPATLTFSAVDGGPSPTDQAIAIANPGGQTLNWNASTDQPWLSVSTASGSLAASGNSVVNVHVNSGSLLPQKQAYTAHVNFSGENVKNGPQSVIVSLTVAPQCSLQVAPTMLSFTGTSLQAAPPTQDITLAVSDGCSSSINWDASSSDSWLTIDTTSGKTPNTVTVGINETDLMPGTYHGSITFSSSKGTQAVPVTFTLGKPTTPAIAASPDNLTFKGTIGQTSQIGTQTVQITNTGGGVLKWSAVASTSIGGNWLAVNTSSGSINSNQSGSLAVTATLLNGLTPGNYAGTITITGTDNAGNASPGSPVTLPVTLVVGQVCTITVPASLNFTGGVNQGSPAGQKIAITANGACSNALNWTAKASTSDGAAWLTLTPNAGSATLANAGSTIVGIDPTGLKPGTYHGQISITTVDGTTQAAVGTPQTVTVTLTIQPSCTLQGPSMNVLTFAAETGINPVPQTFTVGTNGNCTGNVTITPTVKLNEGQGWLAVSPASSSISAGGQATFKVTATATKLASGRYTGVIALDATNSVGVTLNVGAPPTLSVSPASLTVPITTGVTTPAVTIANSGDTPLDWTASLASGAPSFVSLSSSSGKGLDGSKATTISVKIDATGITGGKSFTTNMLINALDPLTGQPAAGSPVKVPLTINVAAPSMQLSTTQVTFATTVGNDPAAQAIILTNTGGDGLSYTLAQEQPSAIAPPGGAQGLVGAQAAQQATPETQMLTAGGQTTPGTIAVAALQSSWLQVKSTQSNNIASGATSTITFMAHTAGLAVGSYTLTEIVTPSVGDPVPVTITLNVAGGPKPTPVVSPTATTVEPSKQASPTSTATQQKTGTSTPNSTNPGAMPPKSSMFFSANIR